MIDENLSDQGVPGGESDLGVVSVSVDIFLLHQAGGPVRSVEHVLQASKAAVGTTLSPTVARKVRARLIVKT
ncbi:hypothetical protein GCM10027089_05920 [Nocardia thraciensis]